MGPDAPVLVEVYSDTVCPWCYVGKRRLEQAIAEQPDVSVQVRWLAFQLNPAMPARGQRREAYMESKFGGREQARSVSDRVEAAAREEGLAFDLEAAARMPNTVDSHRLIRFADDTPEGQDPVVEALFDAFFCRGVDIGGHDALAAVAERAGLDGGEVRTMLGGDRFREGVLEEDAQGRSLGISGVPFFVFDRQYALSGAQPAEVIGRVLASVLDQRATGRVSFG